MMYTVIILPSPICYSAHFNLGPALHVIETALYALESKYNMLFEVLFKTLSIATSN